LIRKATLKDVVYIKDIINGYAKEELMLPRSMSELYECIRNFYVYENEGEVIGCCALQVVWDELAEVMSFAVRADHTGKGIGTKLLSACLEDGHELGVKRFFTLTYATDFFETNGFMRVDKSELPHKIWRGCINCPKFPDCDEVALIRDFD